MSSSWAAGPPAVSPREELPTKSRNVGGAPADRLDGNADLEGDRVSAARAAGRRDQLGRQAVGKDVVRGVGDRLSVRLVVTDDVVDIIRERIDLAVTISRPLRDSGLVRR